MSRCKTIINNEHVNRVGRRENIGCCHETGFGTSSFGENDKNMNMETFPRCDHKFYIMVLDADLIPTTKRQPA